MLPSAPSHRSIMRDMEQELRDELARGFDSHGAPCEGFYTLTRRMETDEDEQFDVDLTILDFLVYKATDLVFEWRTNTDPFRSDLPNALVAMTGEWRNFLSHRHHGRRLIPLAAFRSRLLQFSLIFTHRLQHGETWTDEESIDELREQNKRRGKYWQERTNHSPALQRPFDSSKDFPLSDGALFENRNEFASALNMPRDQRRWVTDVAGTPSLHCLLPLFVELTAARVDLDDDWVPSSEWFDLCGQFMLQAVIEEYLLNGAYKPEIFNAVFAFGCPGPRWAEEGTDVTAMRRLFCDEDDPRQELPFWSATRRQYLDELQPQNSSDSSLEALQAAQSQYLYSEFEQQVLSFLKYLHEGLIKPDLTQVEEGRFNIDGNELSAAESRAMIQRIGL